MNNDIQLPTQCTTEKNKRKKLFWTCLIGFIVVVAASITFLFVNFGKFVPPPFEKAALSGAPTPPSELGYSVATISNDYRVGLCGMLTESNSNIFVYFTNVESNNVWLKLAIFDESGNTLAETGIIKPGQYIESIHIDTTLDSPETPITMKVMAYEPDTYLSAGSVSFNSTIIHA